MRLKIITIGILLLFAGADVFGQFRIDAQIRPRTELRSGYKQLHEKGESPSFITSQRTRLIFSYDTDKLKIRLSPQDIRVWGDESLASSTGVYGDDASLDLHEAVAEIQLGTFGWLSVGRQEFVYDNQWLLAARNWNQHGLSYDGLLFKTSFNQLDIHLAGSWNSLSDTKAENYYLPDRIKTLNFLWLNKNFDSGTRLSFLHIASGVTETDTTNNLNFRQTSGLHGVYKNDAIKSTVDLCYQYGKGDDGRAVSAFLLDADVSYIYQMFSVGLGCSYLSGNRNINSKTDRLFDVLYGARHRFLGHMDYFGGLAKATRGSGIVDGRSYLTVRPNKKIQLQYIAHYFRLAQRNDNTPNNKNLGFENELEFRYKFNQWGTVKAAYLFYLPTDSFKSIQGVVDDKLAQFAFIELTISPTLFVQKRLD